MEVCSAKLGSGSGSESSGRELGANGCRLASKVGGGEGGGAGVAHVLKP